MRTSLRRFVLLLAALSATTWAASSRVGAQAVVTAPSTATASTFSEDDARRWLTYLSSDLLQGRQTFTEGYGLASSYIAGELRAMGVEPLGDEGTYFQAVVRRGYRVVHRSTVTVTARGETRTFAHGDHVLFSASAGGRQKLTFKGVNFIGYGLAPVAGSRDVAPAGGASGRLVLFMGGTPQAITAAGGRVPRGLGTLTSRAAGLVAGKAGAAAAIGLSNAPIGPAQPPDSAAPAAPAPGGGRGGRGTGAAPRDLVTTAHVDRPAPPAMTADETFFDFVLGPAGGGVKALRDLAEEGEPLPSLSVEDVEVTIEIDTGYEVVTTERTQNVVAVVPGSDPVLRQQYVLLGAHLDHVGYAAGTQPPGRANVPIDQDGIWNGADDDGSGSTALLLLAKRFQAGPRPRRSVIFVWHAGEEANLIGSQYMAENPVVPLDDVQAHFNIDMIGRNRDNDPAQSDTVFVIGADRISTDLHNLIVEANGALSRPLRIDYEYNDVNDTNSFYTRSDHYSYASKGVPAAFFFTGTHPDYHANTDTVDKILFPKLLRVTDLIYQSVRLVADRPAGLERDHRGPRAGRGFTGPILPAR